MTTAAPRKFAVGEKVTPDREFPGLPRETIGRVFTVAKVNKVNLRCTADDGGRGINFPADALLPADSAGGAAETDGLLGRPFQPREFFVMGQIVTLKRAFRDWGADMPLIVVADKGEKVNVTPLGGDADRYLRVSHAGLVKRDSAWLLERLMDEATS